MSSCCWWVVLIARISYKNEFVAGKWMLNTGEFNEIAQEFARAKAEKFAFRKIVRDHGTFIHDKDPVLKNILFFEIEKVLKRISAFLIGDFNLL